jgi:hypothetical protein
MYTLSDIKHKRALRYSTQELHKAMRLLSTFEKQLNQLLQSKAYYS